MPGFVLQGTYPSRLTRRAILGTVKQYYRDHEMRFHIFFQSKSDRFCCV